MAKPDKSIDPRILKSAKEEFLEKGFSGASLKEICQKAEVTTGALYKRYRGKEALFSAIVSDTVADLEDYIAEKSIRNPVDLTNEMLIESWNMDKTYMLQWFQFLYERYDDFVLLLRGSQGTRYADFQHHWVRRMMDESYHYYEEAYRRGLTKKEISKLELHIMLTAFWTTIFEPFIHGFTWDEIEKHNTYICDLFDWYCAIGFTDSHRTPS